MRTQAIADPATEQAFRADLGQAVRRAHRAETPLAIAIVEVHGVAEVRDCDGRRAGEALLGTAWGTLRRLSRRDRELEAHHIGAHSFALILQHAVLDEAFTIADAVLGRIERAASPLTACVGLAILDRRRCTDAETLIIAADAALDHARSLGRSRVVCSAREGSGLRWIATSGRPHLPFE